MRKSNIGTTTMNEKQESTKWYIVHDLIAQTLFEFYLNCKKNRKNPGKALYDKLATDIYFKSTNNWIDKFEKQYGVKSLDPVHIFASFNGSKSTESIRKNKVLHLLHLLKVKHKIRDIDFEGCPTPMVINILSARDESAQDDIWELFQRVYQYKRDGLKESDFRQYKNWYGIEFGSLTIFLFWIKSECFLPVDTNTRLFLETSKIIAKIPNNYHTYISVLDKIERYNNIESPMYGPKGLFREIAQTSYNVISKKGIIKNEQSNNFLKFIINQDPDIPDTGDVVITVLQADDIKESISQLSNLGFRIIAIKPLTNCDQRYLNILKKDVIYYFEKAFKISNDEIIYTPEKTISLYDQTLGSQNILKINVTAIVGKNGCGKSSLMELFFRIINNLTYTVKNELSTNDLILEKGLHAVLYYLSSGKLFSITLNDDEVFIHNYEYNKDTFLKIKDSKRKFEKSDLDDFFYTVAVNYSHHALNSKILGEWVQALFHKNDSYQTPLVINPMRTEGNININVENDLVKSRLMANLLSPIGEDGDIGMRQITEYQQAKAIHFTRNRNKNKVLFYKYNSKGKEEKISFRRLKSNTEEILDLVYTIFKIPRSENNKASIIIKETEKYIIKKLVKISVTYSHYSMYFDKDELRFEYGLIGKYIGLLKDDSSHITYKLKQAINFLKYPNLWYKKNEFRIDINETSKNLQNFLTQTKNHDILELLPPPIFKASIKLIDNDNKESDFDNLSSGEKQLIHSVSSILYHIKYLDSVSSDKDELVSYKFINLLLDEIEMYYHPELQRRYLNYLLKMVSKLSLKKIEAINICMVTHSPYILSDVPDFYTLRLEEGNPQPFDAKSFGANIHDLLANDFFMKDGFMGEFAKDKINNVIEYLEDEIWKKSYANSSDQKTNKFDWDKDSIKKIIDLVGEPLIRNSLLDLYNKAFFINKEQIDNEIARLEKLKKQLN